MLLSVCILMKDDADNLRRLAAMVRDLADEVVVVCDEPVAGIFQAAANECGARLLPHRWQNDFSAARNAGLAAARGEWVFWIDSDETLIAPDAPALRRLLQRPDVLGYYVTIEDEIGAATMSVRHHPSLYRRREELRYQGRIHEHFSTQWEVVAQQLGLKVLTSPVRLTHTGYQLDQRPQKQQRNIALLEMELADRPGQLYYLIELGRMLLLAKQSRGHQVLAEAAQIVARKLHEPRAPLPTAAAFLEYALTYAPADFSISRKTAMELALRWFPMSPPLIWLAARCNYEQENLTEAARLLKLVLMMGETKTYDRTLSFDLAIFGDETRLNYGVCCARLGQIGKAIQQFKLIKTGSRFYPLARQNLEQLKKAAK
jgi:hypothetical protein